FFLDFETFQQSLTAAQAQLLAAEKAFEIQKERFELGNTDLLTFNQSNTNLVRSQAELISAEYQLMFQQLLLDYFVGRLDVDSFR
ncbi:MAG: TolC family protein, partial [Bacteroidota bacterium]